MKKRKRQDYKQVERIVFLETRATRNKQSQSKAPKMTSVGLNEMIAMCCCCVPQNEKYRTESPQVLLP